MSSPHPLHPEKSRWLAIAAGTLALFAMLAALMFPRFRSGHHALSFASSSGGQQPAAQTAVIGWGTLQKTLLLDGELRAVHSRTIYSDTNEDAKIVYLPPEGAVVKTGDRLVELDSGTILNKIKEAEEKIVAADNEIVKTRSQHEAALRDLEIERSKLWLALEQARLKAKVPNEVVSRREYQDAQLLLEKADTEYRNHLNKIELKKEEQSAELQVKTIDRDKLKVQLERASSNLKGMRINAPSDGMVLYNDHWNERRKIQVGDVVWGGFPIVLLPDLTEMEVLAQVNEVDGPRLSIGGHCEIKLDSYPDTVITGTVKEISQTAVKPTRTASARIFRVAISLDKTVMEIMKPGMSAQISAVIGETPSYLIVPRAAVQFDGAAAKVVRLENGNARREIAVTILAADALHYAVAGNGALMEKDKLLISHDNVSTAKNNQ